MLAQKFDETSTKSCVSVVLAALNDLCGQVAIKLAQEERQEVFEKIRDPTDLPFISTVFKVCFMLTSCPSINYVYAHSY